MALNDKKRAEVYGRDKAICAFSGLPLWYLDHGMAPFCQPDWVDHIRPVSRGGSDELENLVCASYFYNRKKLNNGADNSYLFRYGVPTGDFYEIHGAISDEQTRVLRSHASIKATDWYFNRAIFNLTVALNDEYDRFKAKRGRAFWIAAAIKKLQEWRRLSKTADAKSFLDRGLVRYPNAPDVQLMLSLTSISEQALPATYRNLKEYHRANLEALASFCDAANQLNRRRALDRARRNVFVTEPLIKTLEKNLIALQFKP